MFKKANTKRYIIGMIMLLPAVSIIILAEPWIRVIAGCPLMYLGSACIGYAMAIDNI